VAGQSNRQSQEAIVEAGKDLKMASFGPVLVDRVAEVAGGRVELVVVVVVAVLVCVVVIVAALVEAVDVKVGVGVHHRPIRVADEPKIAVILALCD